MSSVRKLKMIANAGDPDEALSIRIDVVAAAMKVLEVLEKGRREKLNDFVVCGLVDEATQDMLAVCRRYRTAVRRRSFPMSESP